MMLHHRVTCAAGYVEALKGGGVVVEKRNLNAVAEKKWEFTGWSDDGGGTTGMLLALKQGGPRKPL